MIQSIGPLALAVALSFAGLNGCARFSGDPPSRPITLTLLHTNDTHSHLEPFPRDDELSAGNQGPQQGGIARRKTLIDTVRDSEPNVLLVDAGDHFQGTIFYNAWKGSAEIMAMNALGYDATTLGNHEFDRGPAELGRALRGEPVEIAGTVYPTEKPRPPIVVTNIDVSAEPALRGLFAPSVVLERGGERFGILGVVTEDVPAISSPGPRVRFLDAVSSVQAEADRLRAAGINKIILLSHSGYPVDLERAPRWRGIDLIVSGHDHALLGDPVAVEAVAPGQGEWVKGPYPTVTAGADGVPVLVVSGYEWGRWLGRLKVDFDERGIIQQWEADPMFVRGCAFVRGAVDCSRQRAPEDPAVKARVARYRAPMDRFAQVVIGRAGMVFDGGRTPGLRTQEVPLGNLIADTMRTAAAQSDGAVAALVNSGGIRAGFNAGDATFEHALAVLPFGNTLVVLELTGEELVAALDQGVSQPGEGAFPQVAGLTLVYCAGVPCPAALRPGSRITALTVNGVPVNLAARYRIAINSYMAGGGDGYAMLQAACARPGGYCRDTGLLDLDLLVEAFKTQSPLVRRVEGRIVTR